MERDLLKNKQPKAHRGLGVAYITRIQMILFIQGMQNVLTVPFPKEIVRDLDIINQANFTTFLAGVITAQKLPIASLTLLLANDLLFAKQMLNNDPEAQKLEEQSFVDMVPYEEVSIQKIPFNNAVYITVANKDLYEGIIKAFEQNNFTVSIVLAAYMFSKEINFASPLTSQGLTQLLPKFNNFRQFNFLQPKSFEPIPEGNEKPPTQQASSVADSAKEPPKKSNRALVLGGVFIMLIGILISVYLWSSQQQDSKKESTPPVASEKVTPKASPTPVTEPTEVLGVIDLKIVIQYSSEASQNALLVTDSLNKSGFSQVEKESSSFAGSTIISFDNNIPQEIKNKVISSVSRVYGKVIVQNSNTFKNPVTIQLGTN